VEKENKVTIEGFRLSPQQARLWLLQQGTQKLPYYAQCAVLILGNLDPQLLEAALAEVVQRHEILRTTFHCLPAMTLPLQVISQGSRVSVRDYDLNGWKSQAQEGRIEALLGEASRIPFDFERGPLLQTALVELSPEKHSLLLRLPALCADRASLENLVREISLCYAAGLGERELSEETIQYADLAEWQNELLESAETETGREYWRKQNLSALLTIKLPFENRNLAVKFPFDDQPAERSPNDFAPQALPLVVEPQLAAEIEALARQHGTSTDVLLLACWQILLWRLTGQAEVVVGVSDDGRNYEELQGALGLFEHYLPVSCSLEESLTFGQVSKQLNELAREAETWQEYFTWEDAVGANGDARGTAFFPFGFEFSARPASYSAGQVAFAIFRQYTCIDRFKVKLVGAPHADSLRVTLHYDAHLFWHQDMAHLAHQFLSLLRSAVSTPEAPISALELLSSTERAQLLLEFNQTQRAFPPPQPIHQLIEAHAARQPEAPALVVEDQLLSYGELNRRANQLAHYLQRLGVGPEVLVGLCLERSVEILVGMLGILKAGGAYLPLDPMLPPERLAGMLADAQPRVLLAQQRLVAGLQMADCEPNSAFRHPVVVCLDTDWAEISRESAENASSGVGPENLVYVLFTSGSTGRPKGVAVEHRQLSNYLQGVLERLALPAGASYATVTTLAADLGNTAIFPALATGGCLHVIRRERAADAAALAEYCSHHVIDCLKIVPSHLSALLGAARSAQVLPRRRLVLGGEASSWELISQVRELAPECQILNHYGPTETTVGVLTFPVEEGQPEYRTATVPLGRPLGNTRVYVLDRHFEPVPVWVAGEVYIGGANVTRGYLRAPEQTAEKFIPDPFSGEAGGRLYRTGDLGRYLPDGHLEFLGRVDQQVKVRGFRIELGEIEAVLGQHPAVAESVVVARGEIDGEKQLVAYVVAREEAKLSSRELQRYLQERLPDYMVPSAVMELKSLPLTANGKVDRQALPEPESVSGAWEGEFVAPRTQVEELVAGIWAEVLRLNRVGIHDDFFELGGHSLLVTRIASRVSDAFQVDLPFQIFFEQRTVAALAESIESARRGDRGLQSPPMLPVPRDGDLPLSFAQQRLWFFDQLDPASPAYNIPGAVRLTGGLNVVALGQTLTEIVRRHEVLRTTFPTVDGQPVQVIAEARPMRLPVVNLSELPPQRREAEAQRLVAEEARRPFRLDQGPLLRVGLLRLGEGDHILFFTMHHIISDAWSIEVLVREVAALYEAFSTGQPSPLPELRIQYADFAHWQCQQLQGDVLERHLSYWKQRLDGAPAALELPTDRPRPATQTSRGERQLLELSESLTEALKALSRREGVTLFMTLLAAFKILIRYYTAQDDIVVGANVANRNHFETEGLIGFFVNQLVLRSSLSGNPSFRELLGRVREVALGAYTHQDLPFEKLVEELQPQRDMSRSLLFQVKFELRESITRALELPGLILTPLENDYHVSRYDLHLSMVGRGQGLVGAMVYNIDLFDAGTIARMVDDFETLLGRVMEEPDLRLNELAEMLAEKNRQQQVLKEKELEETSLKKLRALKQRDVSTVIVPQAAQ
jgi:amino acid adenylation domain-containing protein